MKSLKGKSKRAYIFATVTLILVITLFGLNLFLSVIGLNKSVYVDMTPEELYSVSDEMVEECSFINDLDSEKKLKIIFCNDPDNLIDSTVTRVTYLMALKLEKKFDNIEVEEINVNFNPTAVAKYKATSLSEITTSDVIVTYGDRYRIARADSFWTIGSDGQYFSYNGEYKLATIMKSVSLANDSNPVAYFVTGHGETVYDGAQLDSEKTIASEQLKNLLLDRGLRVKTLNLSDPKVDRIPSDCALLIINNPTEDFKVDYDRLDEFYYVSEIEKIDRYLTQNQGALMVAKDPLRKLPILENFLSEWGFSFSEHIVTVPVDEDAENAERTDRIEAVYSTDTESYAYAVYGAFSQISSAPKTVFSQAGYIGSAFKEDESITEAGSFDVAKVYSSFLTSPSSSSPYSEDGKPAGTNKAYDLAAVTTRTVFDNTTAEYTYSYVFCANDADFFSNELLGNAAYANNEIMAALITNISRVDIYASSSLGGTSLNTDKFGGKQLVSTTLSDVEVNIYSPDAQEIVEVNHGIDTADKVLIAVIVAIIPTLTLIVGIVVFVRRKYM